jgi:hypothetical protein
MTARFSALVMPAGTDTSTSGLKNDSAPEAFLMK